MISKKEFFFVIFVLKAELAIKVSSMLIMKPPTTCRLQVSLTEKMFNVQNKE